MEILTWFKIANWLACEPNKQLHAFDTGTSGWKNVFPKVTSLIATG